VLGRIAAAASLQSAHVNGYPALILRLNGEIDAVMAVRIDGGLITGLYARAQSREAVAYGGGDGPAPLSLGRLGTNNTTAQRSSVFRQ
jgi:hypothetical protein